jgi:V8-like Glu-specific endopeptidase
MGAPHGIFWPGTVLFFDGYYVGLDNDANAVYTIPAKPGTSGGGVLNEKGELIGVIHSGLTNMETVGFGTNYEITKDFVRYLNKSFIF